ncbi:MAG TPA: PDC sensor domain-containing protein [Thermoanaerobaculia bacterium]|jgi:hypothetical protein|nr:PDC sensor domain-containing protein [Thermoanaerobaculia bacterium]
MRKLILILVLSASAFAQSAGDVQKMLVAEAEKLRAVGKDATVVAAVKAQNAKKITLTKIKVADNRWGVNKEGALVKKTITGPCADRLRAIVVVNPAYSETFAMDDQGAIVCATAKTTDYWQGDEAKWERAYNGGKGDVFIDRPKLDESAGARIAQISVPVMDGDVAIGVITVGVVVEKLR